MCIRDRFKEFPCKRRFALLGDMLELGELSREAHEELGRLAAESDLYCLCLLYTSRCV